MIKILESLGFKSKKKKKYIELIVPSWRPDISQEVDIVEELVRISGYNKIKIIDPIKERKKSTLNKSQKLFHFLQRSVASKGYLEAITWSFTDSNYNDYFRGSKKEIKIVNPISSELNVLRGAASVLNSIDALMVEISCDKNEIFKLLEKNGFKIFS